MVYYSRVWDARIWIVYIKGGIVMKQKGIDMIFLITGSLMFALAVNLFIIPNTFGEGGVTGLTIILFYLFQWSPGLVNLILNAFLLMIGYKFLDKTTIIYTIIAVVFNSFFLYVTEGWRISSNELLVNAIFGGVFAGIGLGLIIRVGGTTAGSTILARIANKYLDWNISYSLLMLDLIMLDLFLFYYWGPKLDAYDYYALCGHQDDGFYY